MMLDAVLEEKQTCNKVIKQACTHILHGQVQWFSRTEGDSAQEGVTSLSRGNSRYKECPRAQDTGLLVIHGPQSYLSDSEAGLCTHSKGQGIADDKR